MKSKRKTKRWSGCNVLQSQTARRLLWTFNTSGTRVSPTGHQTIETGRPLPTKHVKRGWTDLWSRRLNLAWLPASGLYLRVIQVPQGDPDELRPMLELQIEKLSPVPVSQIVWTYQRLDQENDGLATVVVILAIRSQLETYLGRLEADNFIADHLDVPWLHPILETHPDKDGAWIHLFQEEDTVVAVTAWWQKGQLQDISLLHFPNDEHGPARLAAQLTRMAWAAEIDAWLEGAPTWHLIAPETLTQAWGIALAAELNAELEHHPEPSPEESARIAVGKACRSNAVLNLLPAEFAARYRQRYVDQLWMRGLAATVVVYLLGVIVYFCLLQYTGYRLRDVERQVSALSGSYTNALQLKERIGIFQQQSKLQYAALDCWRVVSELLPPELTLSKLTLSEGETLTLHGTVSSDHLLKVTEFNSDLKTATIEGEPLFERENVSTPQFPRSTGDDKAWNFKAPLRTQETE